MKGTFVLLQRRREAGEDEWHKAQPRPVSSPN
jgi:hypothetical protein